MAYEWERRFQSHILSRGWNYAVDGAVSGLNKNGDIAPVRMLQMETGVSTWQLFYMK